MRHLNEDGRKLPAMAMESLTAAENFGRLARCFSGWRAEALGRMARESRAQSSCISGICALVLGDAPGRQIPAPDTGSPDIRLKKAYARAMRLLSICEEYGQDPEYGPVFRRLAIQQQDHCRKILEIIGSL